MIQTNNPASPAHRPAEADPPEAIQWDIDIPLMTNRYILMDMGFVLGISLFVVFLILAGIFALRGDWDDIGMAFQIIGIITPFMILLFGFTMGIVMRNRIRTRFIVNAYGVDYATVDRWVNFLTSAAVVAGAAARNPTLAGSGLLAASRKRVAHPWKAVQEIRLDPRNRVIILRDSWHAIQRVYCTDENWDDVLRIVKRHFHGTLR